MSQAQTEPNVAADYPEIKPCEHMAGMVSSLSDGSLHGVALWYTKFHVATCPKCTAALAALRTLRERLSALTHLGAMPQAIGLAPERRAKMEEAFEQIERAAGPESPLRPIPPRASRTPP